MKKLSLALNQDSIKSTIRQLNLYKASLAIKNQEFIDALIEYGISIAQQNCGGYKKYITFSKEIEGDERTVGFLIAKDTPIIVKWDYFGKQKTAELSPLLMSEFGSAKFAEVLFDISGVGQGTFPDQKHAFENGWWYKEWSEDHKGEWKRGYGVKPTHPMYHADMEMLAQVENIAREVFGNS